MRISDWSSDVCSSDLRAKLTGALVARRAKDGETVTALNGREYTLTDTMTVIADDREVHDIAGIMRSEEHTSELQSLMRISYAVFCLKKKSSHAFRKAIYNTNIYNKKRRD